MEERPRIALHHNLEHPSLMWNNYHNHGQVPTQSSDPVDRYCHGDTAPSRSRQDRGLLDIQVGRDKSLRRACVPRQGFVGIIRAMFAYREPSYARSDYARSGSDRPVIVDVRKLWTGGVVTAVIVCGLTIAAFLLVRGMLNLPLLGVRKGGAGVYASMFGYAGGAALAALLATAAMHSLLVTTPRPRWFFHWLGGVSTAIAVLLPLTLSQDLAARLATATVNLVLGLAIIALVRSTTAASLRLNSSAELSHTLRMPPDEG